MLRTTMRSARTWRWAKTRRWVGQFSGPASLSPSRSCLGYTTITSGYDLRKAQDIQNAASQDNVTGYRFDRTKLHGVGTSAVSSAIVKFPCPTGPPKLP